MEDEALTIREIDFSYGTVSVLNGTQLGVRRGEILALVGPNGAGKTTLLRVIAGLERAARGAVELNGRDLATRRADQRAAEGLVVVFGGSAVFGDLTVHANLTAAGETIRTDVALLQSRITEAYETFPRLAERRSALANQLSGGEQQMLGLAKALMLNPAVLCIDELSLGLAPVLVARLLDRVREQRDRGTTVVLVEQSLRVALSIADRVATFERGQVRRIDDADRLGADPGVMRAVLAAGAPE